MQHLSPNAYDEASPTIENLAKIQPDLRVGFILMNKFTLASAQFC